MTLRALVFDLDGTIAQTDELHRKAFNETFRDLGLKWKWSATAWARLRRIAGDGEKIAFFTRLRELELPSRITLSDMVARKRGKALQLLEAGGAGLRPGVARLISEARLAGVKLAVCGRSEREAFEYMIFNHFGPDGLDMFDVILTQEDFDEPPSALQAYARLVTLLEEDPNACVAIEDGERGVNAAALSGFNVVATPGLYTMLGDFSRANLVVSDLGEPAAPFELMQGNAKSFGFVSLAALEAWMPVKRKAA